MRREANRTIPLPGSTMDFPDSRNDHNARSMDFADSRNDHDARSMDFVDSWNDYNARSMDFVDSWNDYNARSMDFVNSWNDYNARSMDYVDFWQDYPAFPRYPFPRPPPTPSEIPVNNFRWTIQPRNQNAALTPTPYQGVRNIPVNNVRTSEPGMNFVDSWTDSPAFTCYPFPGGEIPVRHLPPPTPTAIPLNNFCRTSEPQNQNAAPTPSPDQGVRSIPASNTRTSVQPKPKPKPKEVRIPVRKPRAVEASAVKIQKAWREYRVRKSVRKIVEILKAVNEVEEKITEKTVEMIRRDERERLRMNERLMRLLIRLDSVRGFDDRVRVCRKVATRKVILLQERIDSIVAGGDSDSDDDDDGGGGGGGDSVAADDEGSGEDVGRGDALIHADAVKEPMEQIQDNVDDNDDDWVLLAISDPSKGGKEHGDDDAKIEEYEMVIVEPVCNRTSSTNDEDVVAVVREENKRSRELIEKMMEQNMKMMALVTELFERSEKQTQMLTSLTKPLKKTFIFDLSMRNKTKKDAK